MKKLANMHHMVTNMMRHKDAGMYDDSKMLLHSIRAIRAMCDEIEKEIQCGCQFPSWVEYKIYKSSDALKSVLGHIMSTRGQKNAKITIISKLMR